MTPGRCFIGRFFSEPIVLFLIMLAGVHVVYLRTALKKEDPVDARIHIDGERINASIAEWEELWNRSPTPEELEDLIQNCVNEEVLYRHARAMGLEQNDPLTRQRMVQKLEFLTSELVRAKLPEDGELEEYFEQNAAIYQAPDRITFSHVYFDPEKRGDAALDAARTEKLKLSAAGAPNSEKLEAGDRFLLPSYYSLAAQAEISSLMGSRFAGSVMSLAPGEWHGPVSSGYGTHLVYVYEMVAGPRPVFEEVKEMVLDAWFLEREEAYSDEYLKKLMKQYDIVIDELPADRLIELPDDETLPGS